MNIFIYILISFYYHKVENLHYREKEHDNIFKKITSIYYIMSEYNIQKREPDLKDFLDMLVNYELNEELRWDNIDDFSKEINNKVNIFIKNDDGSINKDKCDIIRELFAQVSKLNNFYDSQYREQGYKEEKKN